MLVHNTICVFSLHDGHNCGNTLILLHGCFSMSSSKSASHVVVAWKKKGEEAFENELVEAISVKKLIFKGSAKVGTEVSMQYKNDLWMGKILSAHGKFSHLVRSQKKKSNAQIPATPNDLKVMIL